MAKRKMVPSSSSDAAELTSAERLQADKVWDAKMDDFKRREVQTKSNILSYHYDLGKFLVDLFSNAKKYGNRTADNVSEVLKIDTSTLRRAAQFATKWTDEQFKKLVTQQLSWTDVKILIPVDDLKARAELENKLADNKISQIEANRAVRDILEKDKGAKAEKGVKADNRGGMSPKTVFRIVAETSQAFLERLGEFREGLKLYEKVEPGDRKAEMSKMLKEIKGNFDKIGSQLEKIGKSF